tara:strand:- start:349 stop:627 length:279 start_codon:yes stop_codon:yes gene_type:complete
MPLVSAIKEVNEVLNLRAIPKPVFENFDRLDARVSFAVKTAVRFLETFEALGRKAVSPETYLVDRPDLHRASLDKHIGRHVKADPGHPSNEG